MDANPASGPQNSITGNKVSPSTDFALPITRRYAKPLIAETSMWKRCAIGVVIFGRLIAATPTAQDAGKIDFGRDVQPILRQQCYGCHGPTQQMNGFRLDRRRDAMRGSTASPGIIRPGNSEASLLFF